MSIGESPAQRLRLDGAVMGDRHYRAWVGPPDYYDRLGALQFIALVLLGMREDHTVLDMGCGSLRSGRFCVVYLKPDRYFGIDPARWCVEEGLAAELGRDLVAAKRPRFSYNDDFNAQHFEREFDYVIAAGMLMHMARVQIHKCFEQVANVLATNGLFVGTYLQGDENSIEGDWTYPGIQRYTPEWLAVTAQECGLRLNFLDGPHTLDHRWFVATPMNSPRALPRHLDLGMFAWTQYLADEIRQRGGTVHSLDYYLRQDLNSRLTPQNAAGLVPQALNREPS